MSELGELIADRIRASGPISFAEFMELALYHPELGYYARSPLKTGRAGDFFTSVDVGPIFGELLAKQFAEMWRVLIQVQTRVPVFDLVEAGAGYGRLARDVLDAARRIDPEFYSAIRPVARGAVTGRPRRPGRHARPSRCVTHTQQRGRARLGRRGDLRQRAARRASRSRCGHDGKRVARSVRGPAVRRRRRRSEFVERLGELSNPRIAEYLARAGADMHVGARAEVNLAAEDWVAAAASRLRRGFLVLIDYGHDEDVLYGGSHATGTLTAFKKHSQIADVLQQPGECDITAHVDLSAVTRAAEHAGLDVLGRLDQTYFLLGLGIAGLEGLSLQQRLAMKTLLLPGGLGSTHKVLIFGKDVGKPALSGLSYRVRLT